MPGLPVETGELSHSDPSLNTYICCDALLITISVPDCRTCATGGGIPACDFLGAGGGVGDGGTCWTTGSETNTMSCVGLANAVSCNSARVGLNRTKAAQSTASVQTIVNAPLTIFRMWYAEAIRSNPILFSRAI